MKGIHNGSGQEIYTEYEICTRTAVEVDIEIKQPMSKK